MSIQNRFLELREFLSKAKTSILIISPYMSFEPLRSVLREVSNDVEVVVVCSWRKQDISQGIGTNPEIFTLCQSNNWKFLVDIGGNNRVHLKAYVVDNEQAMIGSANLTGAGMGANIESLLCIDYNHPYWPKLMKSIDQVSENTLQADEDLYDYVVEFAKQSKYVEEEKSKLPEWNPPVQSHVSLFAGKVLDKMPPRPALTRLMEIPSIRRALKIRGLRFSEIRQIIQDNLQESTTRDDINQITNKVMDEIVQSNSEFDIQKRYGTDCLVWKLHPILNKKIMSVLKPYLGKPIRELGLEENLWDDDTLGSKSMKISEMCLGLLPIEIRECVESLSTWQGTLRLKKGNQALYPRPFGPRLQFTTNGGDFLRNISPSMDIESLLPEERIRNELWLPAFCLFEAEKGAKLGDVILRGFGLWESDRNFVASMERDFASDIETLSKQSNPFFDNPFNKASETEVIHTKVAALGGKTKFPLGHPERPMSRYLNTSSLTSIAHEILSHDH